MEAEAPVRVELGAAPWSECRRYFGADDPGRILAGVERVVRLDVPPVNVAAQAKRRAERPAPFDLGGRKSTDRGLIRFVGSDGADALGRARVIQTERSAHRIVAHVYAKRVLGGLAADSQQTTVRQLRACRPAPLELLELIAVLRIVQEVGEVVKKLNAVALRVRRQAR